MLPIGFCYVFFGIGNEVWRNQQWINFPTRTCSCNRRLRSGWWFCIRTCLVRPRRSFRRWGIWCFRGGAFASFSGLCNWMRDKNMSVVGCAVVKSFTTCGTSGSALGSSLVVFQVTIERRLTVSENFFSQRVHPNGFYPLWTPLWFKLSEWSKVLPQVSQRCSLRGFLAGGFPEPVWTSYN